MRKLRASKRAIYPALASADAASTSHENTVTDNLATSITENLVLNNPVLAIDDVTFSRDEDNKTTSPAAKALTKQDDEPMPTSTSEPVETLNNDVSQEDPLLSETDQERLARLRGEIVELGWKKRQY